MSLQDTLQYLTERHYEIHGRARGRSGACHLVASLRTNEDWEHKEARHFMAVAVDRPNADFVQYTFVVAPSVRATADFKRSAPDFEDFLLTAGLAMFRRFLAEDDTPGRRDKFMLTSHNGNDLVTHDQDSEIERAERQVLEALRAAAYRGEGRLSRQAVEDAACTTPAVLNRILGNLAHHNFVKGALGNEGMKLTHEGEAYLKALRAADRPPVAPTAASQQPGAPAALYETPVAPRQQSDVHFYDVFVSHASEDKEDFVRPLAKALQEAGLRVWLDEWELKLGDSLRRSIDKGLRQSRFGLVVFSHAFFAKEWPQNELDGLAALAQEGEKKILPVWHNIAREEVANYSPMMADKLAAKSSQGIPKIVEMVLAVCR
jgi:hypothetical protein